MADVFDLYDTIYSKIKNYYYYCGHTSPHRDLITRKSAGTVGHIWPWVVVYLVNYNYIVVFNNFKVGNKS